MVRGGEWRRGAERWREVQRDADERCRGAEVQRFKGAAEVHRCIGGELWWWSGAEVQRCRGAEVQRYRGHRCIGGA